MRKIEQLMLTAIKERRNWRRGNTEVSLMRREDDKPLASVYLHGNHIATIGYNRDTHPLEVDSLAISLAGWDTPTTRSRLGALTAELAGATVHRVKGETKLTFAKRMYTSGAAGYYMPANGWVMVL